MSDGPGPVFRDVNAAVFLVAAVVGGVAWLIGVNWAQSALLALAVMVVGGGYALLPVEPETDWPPLPLQKSDGARHEISRLASDLTGRRHLPPRPVARLRHLAEQRLVGRGIELADRQQAEPLLGPVAYRVLTGPNARISYRAFRHTVDVVEHLDSHAPGPSASHSVPATRSTK